MIWFGRSNKPFEFEIYSMSHFVILAVFIIVSAAIFLLRKRLMNGKWRKVEIGAGIFLLLFEITYHSWMIGNGIWKVSRSLPLEICNIGLILCIILLFTRTKIAFEFLFFISLLGATQAIFSPALTYGFPHFRFFHFFLSHMMLVWVTLYFTWAKGYYLTFCSVIKLVVFLNLLLPFILFINKHANGNYWFLRRKPEGPSLYAFVGPYPWYIFSLEGLLIVLSLAVWLIFRKSRKSDKVKQLEA